jgi:hypothetical protein
LGGAGTGGGGLGAGTSFDSFDASRVDERPSDEQYSMHSRCCNADTHRLAK